jgi:hypothetical protein
MYRFQAAHQLKQQETASRIQYYKWLRRLVGGGAQLRFKLNTLYIDKVHAIALECELGPILVSVLPDCSSSCSCSVLCTSVNVDDFSSPSSTINSSWALERVRYSVGRALCIVYAK